MPIGPGAYDDICTEVRERTKAGAVILIVVGGDRGEGCSMQAPLIFSLKLPIILRELANNIEADLKKGKL